MIFVCLAIYYATQNYNCVCSFENLREQGEKLVKHWGTVLKKGGIKFCPPKFSSLVLHSKFDVDYDIAIKHDLLS